MATTNKPNLELRFVIIGAGMAGILSSIKLLESGYTNITIYEKADKVGGTWRENTYPGLTCDVPSHAYTYSFEPNPDWTRQLPPGAEIQEYFERMTAKYQLEKLIHFNEEITRCEFLEGSWQLETAGGTDDRADVVIAATGVLHHPSYPKIKGIDRFAGDVFHSARWDHSVPLDGKRIAIIGNGSTGVQIVSALAGRASQVTHFQRTAQWIMPVENPLFSEEEKLAFRTDKDLLHRTRNDQTYIANVQRFTEGIANPNSAEMKEIEDVVLANLESSVKDPVLKEQLRPSYRAACKRLIFSPDYYEVIQQSGVQLETRAIEGIEELGVRLADGELQEFDLIVLATGFRADQFMRPMQLTGRNGTTLEQAWSHGPRAFRSISIPEFPNFYMLNGPSGPVGNFSLIDVVELQWDYIAQLIELVATGKCKQVSPKQDALDIYEQERVEAAKKTIFGSGCKSWYLDDEGVPATWPWSYQKFVDVMKTPTLDDYDLRS